MAPGPRDEVTWGRPSIIYSVPAENAKAACNQKETSGRPRRDRVKSNWPVLFTNIKVRKTRAKKLLPIKRLKGHKNEMQRVVLEWILDVKVTQSCLTLWNSPGQNTGVCSCFLLLGIFPTQRSSPGLPHCRELLYQLRRKGSPRILECAAYPFSRGSPWPRNGTGSPALQVDSLPTELAGKPCGSWPERTLLWLGRTWPWAAR